MAKQASGAGSIRKRNDGTWEGRFCVGRDPGSGKLIRKSVYGKTQKEVREKLTALTADIDKGEYFEPSRIMTGQWLDIWTTDYLDGVKYLTAKNYRAQVETHIRPALGAVKLSALTPDMIKRFYNRLLKEGRTVPKRDAAGKPVKDKNGAPIMEKAPLSAKSVRNVHGILTKCLSTAVDMEYIKQNPCLRLSDKLPRAEKTEIHPLSDEQVKLFMKELDGEEYKRLFQAILFMGLRESEAAGLTWDCIDFDKGTVTVKQQLIKRPKADGGYTLASTKSDKQRVIAPAQFVMDILKQRRLEQLEQRFSAGDLWQGFQTSKEQQTALCFTTATGTRLCPQTILSHYKKLAARIGAPETNVHSLRHSFAVISLQNGDDPKTVQSNLGHYSAAFTLDVYGHVSERMKRESAERMQEYIESMG